MNPEFDTDVVTLTSPDVPELEVVPAGTRDVPSVDGSGELLTTEIDGVLLERLAPIRDDRGSLTEVIDLGRPFWQEPIVYSYCFTIRPGRIKGWGMHKRQADRYCLMTGQVRVVLYDGRTQSPTYGRLGEFFFEQASPGLLRIPPGVWHADQNWGESESVVFNFPTRTYDRRNPDKYRIDPHSGAIPFDWKLRDR